MMEIRNIEGFEAAAFSLLTVLIFQNRMIPRKSKDLMLNLMQRFLDTLPLKKVELMTEKEIVDQKTESIDFIDLEISFMFNDLPFKGIL